MIHIVTILERIRDICTLYVYEYIIIIKRYCLLNAEGGNEKKNPRSFKILVHTIKKKIKKIFF
jgi:hypothetical protein